MAHPRMQAAMSNHIAAVELELKDRSGRRAPLFSTRLICEISCKVSGRKTTSKIQTATGG